MMRARKNPSAQMYRKEDKRAAVEPNLRRGSSSIARNHRRRACRETAPIRMCSTRKRTRQACAVHVLSLAPHLPSFSWEGAFIRCASSVQPWRTQTAARGLIGGCRGHT
eukprot:6203892-Pleurochrysis_carterae.AAC.5